MQAHFNAAGVSLARPPSPRSVKEQIRRLGDLGLKVNISEMDVRVSKLPPDIGLRQLAQREIYHDIIAAALSEPSFNGIWLWGFTDSHTWVSNFYYEDEPLIFDKEYRRKDCYYALREAISTVAVGGVVGGKAPLYKEEDHGDDHVWGHKWLIPESQVKLNSPSMVSEAGSSDRPDWLQEG